MPLRKPRSTSHSVGQHLYVQELIVEVTLHIENGNKKTEDSDDKINTSWLTENILGD